MRIFFFSVIDVVVVEPRKVEIHSDAQHDLSADNSTAADRQSEPSAERN